MIKSTDIISAIMAPAFSEHLESSYLTVSSSGLIEYTMKWCDGSWGWEKIGKGRLSAEQMVIVNEIINKLGSMDDQHVYIDDVGSRTIVARNKKGKIRKRTRIG